MPFLRFAVLSKKAVTNGRGAITARDVFYFDNDDIFCAAVHPDRERNIKPMLGTKMPASFTFKLTGSETHSQPSKGLSYYTKAEILEARNLAEKHGYTPSLDALTFFDQVKRLPDTMVLVKVTDLY